jgi:hypothetical protein
MAKVITLPPTSGKPVLGRTYFTSKSGKRFYAKDYGYKCWPIGKSGPPK